MKTRILSSITFFQKLYSLLDNLEKCGTTRQATDGKIIQHMRFVCWVTYATETHSECIILIAFPWQHWLQKCATILLLYKHCLSC